MIIKDISDFLESIAPLNLQEDYDNAGLIVGNPNTNLKGVLFSLDATLEVVQEAKQLGCNLVISHHPIIFKGLKKINGTNYVEKAVIEAIKNDIALYAIHTNLDNVLKSGVNAKIAEKLEVSEIEILSPKLISGTYNKTIGAGIIGNLPQIFTYYQFLDHVKTKMKLSSLRATQTIDRPIFRVALCGGSGSFLIPSALKATVDAYITADLTYHDFFEANNQTVLVDIGHFESEQYTIELLFELVTGKFTNFASHCTKIITNPVQYY
ncbi:MAG: Nif3-like dinuclear metal center hexameric protein [Bacteroidota bacterium]|nr:Nif3-like dinuclear metal center hexameric protein [Bacteroidota bacterium]